MEIVVTGVPKRSHVEEGEYGEYFFVHSPNYTGSEGEDI